MSTREHDMRAALQRAALILFEERGFERTSAAAIADRAGVTERTFFRYFPDKREVLFAGQQRLRDALVDAVDGAPEAMSPLAALFRALHGVTPMLEANRAFAEPRQRLIARTPALHERELAKLDALAHDLAVALRKRGTPPLAAILAAQAAIAAFAQAFTLWIEDPGSDLGTCLDLCHANLPRR